MAVNTERGGAIMFLFVAVALFGALSYAFLQGSRTSTTMITSEADKVSTFKSQDCANAVSMATKRLQTRGCQPAQISSDATGAVGSGPADGSCAIYHINGGGMKGACVPPPAPAPADICTTGPIGTVCTSDGAFYIGDIGGNRIYAAAANINSGKAWKTGSWGTATPGTTSNVDGFSNTAAMIAADAANHPAANACYTQAPTGTWYLPAKDELYLLWSNRADIDLPSKGFNMLPMSSTFWSSTDTSWPSSSWRIYLINGQQAGSSRNATNRVRCVRR